MHQGVGALELVGLPAPALMLRAAKPRCSKLRRAGRAASTPAAVESIERGSFALLDYLARLLAGKPVSPVALFPQYQALQELAGADRMHPADLWTGLALARGAERPMRRPPERADADTQAAARSVRRWR